MLTDNPISRIGSNGELAEDIVFVQRTDNPTWSSCKLVAAHVLLFPYFHLRRPFLLVVLSQLLA